jgi:hypothetical protein
VRLIHVFPVVIAGVLSAGCYTLEPAGGVTPEVGTGVAFDINDAGRVALGGSMGPEIDQIQGRLLSKDGTDYVVGVTMVQLLKGGTQVWHGESVRISPSYVNTMYLRRFSAGKTIAISAVGVGAVLALAGTALVTTGALDPPKTDTGTTGTQRRGRVPRKLPPKLKLSPFPPTTP